jgi:amidohydrolase
MSFNAAIKRTVNMATGDPANLPTGVVLMFAAILCVMASPQARAASDSSSTIIEREALAIAPRAIGWRRDIHQHPELGYSEIRTATLVAEHLRSLGLEVQTGIAHTGVVGVLRGGQPGLTVGLRAELDALPVTEDTNVAFASRTRVSYKGQDTGVMHACGHDVHLAVLMATATVLSRLRARLHGTVVFIFQPDEEQTAEPNEKGGATEMMMEGLLERNHLDALFALHVTNQFPVGEIRLAPGAAKAGGDALEIVVTGRSAHAAKPWEGIDPVVSAAQIVLGLQTVISRQIDPIVSPTVLSIGMIRGGIRPNIIPDSVSMGGGLRWFDERSRRSAQEKIERMTQGIVSASGATASVSFMPVAPPVVNDAALARSMVQTLLALKVLASSPSPTSDDIGHITERVPGLYFYLGGTPTGVDPTTTAANHSPKFFVDEGALLVGIRAMSTLAVGYLNRR